MYRRKNPKTGRREGNWYISVRGHRQTSGYDDKKKAEELEHKLNEEARDRANGLAVLKWEEACRDWIEHNPAVAATYAAKKLIAFWTPLLAGWRLPDITSKVVHKQITEAAWVDGSKRFLVDLINPVPANATANNYVGFVSRVIRGASNLNPKLTYYQKSRGRDRWLSVGEWRTLEAKMNPDLRDVSLFALSTGLREANVMGLRWEWVKGDWILIPAEFTKTEKPYGIPLNRTAHGVVQARRGPVRHPELVFLCAGRPWYRVLLWRQFTAALGASGVPHITFHGLRHTFTSWLAQKGVDYAIRARLGCWSTEGGQVDHYSHFNVESLRPFSELIDSYLAASDSQQKASI